MIETYKELSNRFATEDISLSGYTLNKIYEIYYDDIYPYLGLITKYMNLDDKAINQEEIRISLGVSKNAWKVCKKLFPDLKSTLESKRNIMKFKSEKDLQTGIKLSPTNHQLIKMQFQLYNDEFKDKGNSIDINLPKTIKIDIEDASRSDEDLQVYDEDLKNE